MFADQVQLAVHLFTTLEKDECFINGHRICQVHMGLM